MTKLIKATGDLLTLETDAIVNAANPLLKFGSGVCGKIFIKAGLFDLTDACDKIRSKYSKELPLGDAVITPAFQLPAKWIIHAISPTWIDGSKNEAKDLAACYTNSLKIALENEIQTIAFSAISTGAHKFPKEQADKIAEQAVKEFTKKTPKAFKEIWLITYGDSENAKPVITSEEEI